MATLALLILMAAAALTTTQQVAADEHDDCADAAQAEDECPPESCPPGCDDACTCCVPVRGDVTGTLTSIGAPAHRAFAYARVAAAAPPSTELDERAPVPR